MGTAWGGEFIDEFLNFFGFWETEGGVGVVELQDDCILPDFYFFYSFDVEDGFVEAFLTVVEKGMFINS